MNSKKIDDKIDAIAIEAKRVAAAAAAALETATTKGEHRVAEAVEKVGRAASEISTKVAHVVHETAQRVAQDAKEVASKAEHRSQPKAKPAAG